MKFVLLVICLISSTLAVTSSVPPPTVTPAPGDPCIGDVSYCIAGSDIILRCDGTSLHPGNCADNLDEPPNGALCIESYPDAGDAVCSAIGSAKPPFPSATGTFFPYTTQCILGGSPSCPSGSVCTQTETCGGLCIASPTSVVQIPCTVSKPGCPTGSTCTPTMTCPTSGPCGGACIGTAPMTVTTTAALPSIPCVVGANDCPSASFCTQTMTCKGLCSPTQPTTTPTTTPGPTYSTCTLGAYSACSSGSICTQTEVCGGLCIASPTSIVEIPCTVGQPGCPTGSTCTPTMTCPTSGSCGGACIATAPMTVTTTGTLPSITCVVGANDCPSASFCTQTTACGGLCIPTQPPTTYSTCILGAYPGCSSGSICTQTETCGGLCIASPTSVVQIPCTVSKPGCPTGSTCTPTMTCPTSGPCGGACIGTAPMTVTTTAALPSIPCVVGANDCPSASFCTQTMTCGGLCIPTQGPTVTSSTGVTTPTPSATTTTMPCSGPDKSKCPHGSKCVRKCSSDRQNPQCQESCVPV